MTRIGVQKILPLLLCLLCGCAGHLREYTPLPDRDRPVAGVWVFRHKVRLDFPGRKEARSFDGMMRLDLSSRSIHAVGLGGMGMQLFDVMVTENETHVRYLHPLMRRIPGAADHIAFCLRRIWFDCLTIMPQTTAEAGEGWRFAASGNTLDAYWPDIVHFSNTRDNYALTIRLLRAQREDTL